MTLSYQPAEHGRTPGLPDELFEHDGLITKRHVRATALAWLRPVEGQLLWDLGTGSGAVAIEWALAAADARAVGVDRNPGRVARARANVARFGLVGQVSIVEGTSAERIAGLADPDAVFIGGGARAELIDLVVGRLRPGARLVVHAVTLETEQVLIEAQQRHGGELSRLEVSLIEPIGGYRAWRAARPITQWFRQA